MVAPVDQTALASSSEVSIKQGRKKAVIHKVKVLEAFKKRYIKIYLNKEKQEVVLKYDKVKELYETDFFGITFTCNFEVTENFRTRLVPVSGKKVEVRKSNSGFPSAAVKQKHIRGPINTMRNT